MSPGSRTRKRLCVSLLTAESFSKGCYPAKAGSEKKRSGFELARTGQREGTCVSLLTAGSFSKGCYPAKAGSEKKRSGFELSPDGAEGRKIYSFFHNLKTTHCVKRKNII